MVEFRGLVRADAWPHRNALKKIQDCKPKDMSIGRRGNIAVEYSFFPVFRILLLNCLLIHRLLCYGIS